MFIILNYIENTQVVQFDMLKELFKCMCSHFQLPVQVYYCHALFVAF